jgi:hypothetical protein
MQVYLLIESVEHEGDIVLSAHATEPGAAKAADTAFPSHGPWVAEQADGLLHAWVVPSLSIVIRPMKVQP